MHPLINIAMKAARRAGDLILRSMDRLDTLTITTKSHRDYVSEVDQQAEQEIIRIIRQAYPNHGILAEESGESAGDQFQWIIDPLDGTSNFIHGIPHFAVSIAVKVKDRIEHGLIYDPVRQEIFHASRGEGAKLNDRRIRVTEQTQLTDALMATGFPFRHETQLKKYMLTLNNMVAETGDIRRFGSAALDLAYVAAGRFDGYWEYNLAPWDIAAGAVIVREAGGTVCDPQGQENYLASGNIVAANVKLIKKMLQVINTAEK